MDLSLQSKSYSIRYFAQMAAPPVIGYPFAKRLRGT